ncbi:MAG: helix-turn-helix domain-containing protein [Pseudomonadota bacterium]
MPDWKKDHLGTSRIGVLLFDQFSNYCLANAVEPLRAANMALSRETYAWHILTPGDAAVASSSGFPVMPTCGLNDAPKGDFLFVISSYEHRRHASEATRRLLRRLSEQYTRLAGFDTGGWLMADAGLLDGHRATIHSDLADTFAERYPEVLAERKRWVDDGTRLTAGGAAAAFELVLHLIGKDHGTALALEIAALFLNDYPGVEAPGPRAGGDPYVARALLAMERAIESPVTIPEIAAAAGCPQRELEERFHRQIGALPRTVYRRTRLLAARRILTEDRTSVAETAARCGYGDPSAFARAYRREFGHPPSQGR